MRGRWMIGGMKGGLGAVAMALLLAATQSEGDHVDIDRVRWMIDRGCGHEVALRIVL